jgi:hypothetical protein
MRRNLTPHWPIQEAPLHLHVTLPKLTQEARQLYSRFSLLFKIGIVRPPCLKRNLEASGRRSGV